MAIPVVRPYPYLHTPKHGGQPVPTFRTANIDEKRRSPRLRPVVRSQKILRKNVAVSAPVEVHPGPLPPVPPPPPTKNLLPQPLGIGIKQGRPQIPPARYIRGRGIRPAHTESVIRAHVNRVRELQNVGNGKVLVMVACGPSVNEVPLEQLKGNPKIEIMSINRPDRRIWPTTYWAFCDYSQYNRNKELWDTYTGTIINSSAIKVAHQKQILVRSRSGQGFSRDLTNGFYIGRSTTYANMQMALWMGYDRVYIFGCDMGAVNGQLHYYGRNPDVDDKNREDRFGKEAEHYQYAAIILSEAERKKFYFCSTYNQWPFVNQFNRRDQNTVIPEILEYADRRP